MRPLARLRAPPRDPPGGRDRRHARRPRAARRCAARSRSRAATRSRPTTCPTSPLLARRRSPTPAGRARPTLDVGLRRARPTRAAASRLEPHSGDASGPLTLAWVVPPWRVGSGGHTTIFRLIRQLELRGHRCAIFVFDPFGRERAHRGTSCARRSASTSCPVEARGVRRPRRLRLRRRRDRDRVEDRVPGPRPARAAARRSTSSRTTSREFYATSARVDLGRGDLPDGLPLHRLHAVDGRHPRATATGSRRAGSSAAPTSTCSRSPASEGREPRPDRRLRAARDRAPRGRPRDRRAWPCSPSAGRRSAPCCSARASASTLAVRRPRTSASCRRGGSPSSTARRASGVVFSLTTHSLVAHEMMASGLPVVELEGDNVGSRARRVGRRRRAGRAHARTRSPTRVERLLDDREAAAAMARARARVRRGAHLGARGRPGRGRALRLPLEAVERPH